MPRVNEMIESKYLKKEDVGDGKLMTISGFEKQNVAPQGEPAENKWTVYFDETSKPLVLNTTNLNLLSMICGSDNTDDWVGKKVVLFNDPSVSYGGKLIGGIRVRAAKLRPGTNHPGVPAVRNDYEPPAQPTHRQAPSTSHAPDDFDEDVPF
jgi:hypothetical protein